jgi:hypothetical protein
MKFDTDRDKEFQKDLESIIEALRVGEKISFSKFCDGEWAIMTNKPMPEVQHNEWTFDPNEPNDAEMRVRLIKAFQYKNPRYFIGIAGPAIWGAQTFLEMKHNSLQDEEMITWADIFVNANYRQYVDEIVPLFSEKPVVLFCNSAASTKDAPFDVVKMFTVEDRAWKEGFGLVEETKSFVVDNEIKDHIFLFACGPIGNVLCHELTELSEDNTYLDVGSTLNPYLGLQKYNRDYYDQDSQFAKHKGIWLYEQS